MDGLRYTAQGNTTSPAHKAHPAGVPAMCCDWHSGGTQIFVGYGDNTAHSLDLNTQVNGPSILLRAS